MTDTVPTRISSEIPKGRPLESTIGVVIEDS